MKKASAMVSSSSGQRHHAHATAETTIPGPRHTGRLPPIHRHFTVTRRNRIGEDQKAKRAAAAPSKTTAPATHALTLFTHRTHRSGVPPPFRRRRRRRREEEPTAAPGKRGRNGDSLSVASLNCSRGKGKRGGERVALFSDSSCLDNPWDKWIEPFRPNCFTG
jgi:hypothetical protein